MKYELRDQWNTCVPRVPATPNFKKVHDFTLHPNPIIPIFSEIYLNSQPILGNVWNFLH